MKFIRNLIFSGGKVVSGQKPAGILHIGVEKTGTTTIQEFLHLNRKLLAEQEICFPRFMNLRNHWQMAVFCCNDKKSNQFTRINNIDDLEKRKKWKHDFNALFKEEMLKISGNYHTVIFSSEHLSTFLMEESEIQSLNKILEPFISSFIIIIYIRRQDLIASSMISNYARVGLSTTLPTGSEIVARHFYNYRRLLKKWSEVFGKENIRLRIFEKEQLIHQDLLQDFMQQAGIRQDEKFRLPQRLNTALSATAIEAAWLFNQKFPAQDKRSDFQLLNKLRLEMIHQINEKYPGPGKMLLKNDAREFLNIYKNTNRKVAAEWFGREKLFNEDFSMYTENLPSTDHQLVKLLVEDFINQKGLT